MINPLDTPSGTGSGLSITNQSAQYLKETGGWAKFLAILGFVGLGFLVLVGLFFGTVMSTMGMGSQLAGMEFLFAVIYIFIAALYFFPLLFLFRFASKVRDAISANDTSILTTAFENLKSHYKFIGILMAIFVGLYAIFFLIAILAGLMRM